MDKDVLDYLAKYDNLKLAVEIADYLDQIEEIVHRTFWQQFNHLVSIKLPESRDFSMWSFQPFDMNRLRTAWNRSFIVPKTDLKKLKNHLRFEIGQSGSPNYKIYWGLTWHSTPEGLVLPSIKNLNQELQANQILSSSGTERFAYTEIDFHNADFLSKMYWDQSATMEDVVMRYVKIFDNLAPCVEAVHLDISNMA